MLRSSVQNILLSGNLQLGKFVDVTETFLNLMFTTVLQYGFIAIFSVAFPLAPLVALIKNIFKIRYDALRLLKRINRPIPERVMDVGEVLKYYCLLSKVRQG